MSRKTLAISVLIAVILIAGYEMVRRSYNEAIKLKSHPILKPSPIQPITIPTLWVEVPKLPTEIRIHGERWLIVKVDMIGQPFLLLAGQTFCDPRIIAIAAIQDDIADQANTLVHEVEHAMTCDAGEVHNEKWNNSKREHSGIYWSAREWQKFLYSNPEAVRFIQSAGIPKEF
jgi:hypothetical protein